MLRNRLRSARSSLNLSKITQSLQRLKAQHNGGLIDVTAEQDFELEPKSDPSRAPKSKLPSTPSDPNTAHTPFAEKPKSSWYSGVVDSIKNYASIQDMESAIERGEAPANQVLEHRTEADAQKLVAGLPGFTYNSDDSNLPISKFDQLTGIAEIMQADQFFLNFDDLTLLRKVTQAMVFTSHDPTEKNIEYMFQHVRKMVHRPDLMIYFTPYAWELLWTFEPEDQIPSYKSRLLGDMMVEVEAKMTRKQELKYIGGLYWNGAQEDAMQRWEDLVKRDPAPEVYTVGVKMMALQCRPWDVEKLIEDMIEKVGYADHRHFGSAVQSYNHIFESEKAWKAFEKLEEWESKNGTRTSARQLDDLAMSFLDAQQPGYGLRVFKKMVRDIRPQERAASQTFTHLNVALRELQASTMTPGELNEISIDSLHNLPPAAADRFFYGAWILNLLRMNRMDLATYVAIAVMPSQDYETKALEVNWVIQGYLEQNNYKMAEYIANHMIYQRFSSINNLTFADSLKADPEIRFDPPADAGPINNLVNPDKVIKRFPEATIQTFSLMIQYHSRRQNLSQVLRYTNILNESDIEWNSYILNHILFALLRASEMRRLALTFKSMTPPSGTVTPDQVTFQIMWQAVRSRYTQNKRKTEFITPRELFVYTLQQYPKDGEETVAAVEEQTEGQTDAVLKMWYHMIQSFFLSLDLVGALIALQVGVRVWNFPIDAIVVRLVALGVYKNRPTYHEGHPHVSLFKLNQSSQALMLLGERLDMEERRRGVRKGKGGGGSGGMGGVKRIKDVELEEKYGSLEALTRLLWMELRGGEKAKATPLLVDEVRRGKEDMGLGEVELGLLLEGVKF